jgi:hypothetical protein
MQVLKAISNFLKKFFKQAIQDQLDIIMPISREAIKMVANDPSIITSDEKRARAISFILAELTAKQLTVAKRLVNLAVEIAVVEFKGIE